ncbi:thiaminase II [Nocardiopsis composta]
MSGFCAEVWNETAGVRAAIDDLPFVRGLADGSLSRDRFDYYMAQDALYLRGYARALASAAARADRSEEIAFFAKSAHDAIAVESSMHEGFVGDVADLRPSPTCTAYVSYLLGLAQTQGYGELAAGVLPCFWVYTDVGARLMEKAGDLAEHPYGEWISTYADEEFAASTRRLCAITDGIAERSDAATVARMREAFATATTYEFHFWEAAWEKEGWAAF